MGKQWKQWQFIFLGSKITADGDCSHEIKRHLFLGRKTMTNSDSILKNRDSTLPTKVHLLKAMVFPVVMYRVGDAIQPSHPLLHPSPPAFNLSQHQGSIGVSAAASVLPMNTQDWFPLGWTGWISSVQGTLRSLLKNHSSKAPILQPLAFSIAQHPYPSIYDYWKNHSFE